MTEIADHRSASGITLGGVLRSERTTLCSLRSSRITLDGAALPTVGLSAAFGHGYGGIPEPHGRTL